MDIIKLLDLTPAEKKTVSIIGSGGKTTLLWLLARFFRQERVLASTTTKMDIPAASLYDFFPYINDLLSASEIPLGLTFCACPMLGGNKVSALSAQQLELLHPRFDKLIVEADGSRRLPYKGWADCEPVVPDFTDITVAVLPVPEPHMQVTAEYVHRLPLFLELAGAEEGEELRPVHLARVIAHPKGLLAGAKGKIVLLFNKAESPHDIVAAQEIYALLPEDCRRKIWKAAAGSALHNTAVLL